MKKKSKYAKFKVQLIRVTVRVIKKKCKMYYKLDPIYMNNVAIVCYSIYLKVLRQTMLIVQLMLTKYHWRISLIDRMPISKSIKEISGIYRRNSLRITGYNLYRKSTRFTMMYTKRMTSAAWEVYKNIKSLRRKHNTIKAKNKIIKLNMMIQVRIFDGLYLFSSNLNRWNLFIWKRILILIIKKKLIRG